MPHFHGFEGINEGKVVLEPYGDLILKNGLNFQQ
jgi:hypothetical protein